MVCESIFRLRVVWSLSRRPVSVVNNSFIFFINWFVASESSVVFLALRSAMITLGAIDTPAGAVVQLLFALSFFVVRIIPQPWIVMGFLKTDWAVVPPMLKVIAMITVPLPSFLNWYWGVLIVQAVMKAATGGQGKKAQRPRKVSKAGQD